MENEPIRSFTQLWAWQKAREVRKSITLLVRSWPAEERYRLADQIIRSSRSACANIAEGFGRYYERDNLRFCRNAKGSLYETMDHLSVAFDEGFIDKTELKRQWALSEEAVRVLNGYMNHLRKLSGENMASEPEAVYGIPLPIFTDPPDELEVDDDLGHGAEGRSLGTDN